MKILSYITIQQVIMQYTITLHKQNKNTKIQKDKFNSN